MPSPRSEPVRSNIDAFGSDLGSGAKYAELHVHTCYSLLEGASSPRELVDRAVEQGHDVLAVTDRNNFYGTMVFAQVCMQRGIRPIFGVELTVAADPDDPDEHRDLTLLAADERGYANLCRLVSLAHGWGLALQSDRDRRRRSPCAPLDQLRSHTEGVICLTGGRNGELARRAAANDRSGAREVLGRWLDWFGRGNVWVELHDNLAEGDLSRNRRLVEVAGELDVGVVATGCVHYHERERHRLHDALCAIRHRATLETSQAQRRPNNQFYLRSPEAQAARFADLPEAVANSRLIADRCTFQVVSDLDYALPSPPVPAGHTPDSWLEHLCRESIADRYLPEQRHGAYDRLEEELRLIARHDLAGFFLIYHQVLGLAAEVAREVRGDAPRALANLAPGRGRGSSVGSIVCYLIGLSHIDPVENELFLGRFLNEEMHSLPDIDLDFPREIRDKLFQRVYEHWGIDHAALVATFPRYRIRSAVRDLGKVLGLPLAEIDRLAKLADGYSGAGNVQEEMERVSDLQPLIDAPGWRHLIELAQQLTNFPRHVSQHVGGVVIASDPLIDCVPIQPTAWPGRYVCQWDKDDIDDARMVKIDFLSLGMLSLVEECLDLCAQRPDGKVIDLAKINYQDEAVYKRIGKGDTVGVFQIESRAQASILPRTQPKNLHDLAAQVAIIRPGPIIGGAVHRYTLGKQHPEQVEIPYKSVRKVLEETHGVVLFQEQVVQVATEVGGFSPGEAEKFRRVMGRKDWDNSQAKAYRARFVQGAMTPKNPGDEPVDEGYAQQLFNNLEGFAQFGFPKSHAAAFGLLAYQTAWLKEHYPTEFFCALFNNWPMGFYPPHVFTNDARRWDVEISRPDINLSDAHCTVEADAVRLGLGYIKTMGSTAAEAVVTERAAGGPFLTLRDFTNRTGLAGGPIENAIRIGAFDSFGLSHRELLWQLWLVSPEDEPRPGAGRGWRQLRLDLPTEQDHVSLPDRSGYQAMSDDYEVLGLSPTSHPMEFLRQELGAGIRSAAELRSVPLGTKTQAAGMVVCRQRPGTAKGAVYLLLEDETGLVNVVLTPRIYEGRRTEVRSSSFLRISGVMEQLAGDVATLRAHTVDPVKPQAGTLQTPEGKNWG